MKKFLITISPVCVVLFVLMWISWGMKGALVFFGAVLFIVALVFVLAKWMEFVDKHIFVNVLQERKNQQEDLYGRKNYKRN